MTLHNYRSRQVHETLNGVNPSSGFRDMRSGPKSLDPICGKFDKFLAHGQAYIGQMGKWPWQCTTTGLDNSIELRMDKIGQAVTEIWVPQVWQPPARPPTHPPASPDRDDNTPPARRAEGWKLKCRGYNHGYVIMATKMWFHHWFFKMARDHISQSYWMVVKFNHCFVLAVESWST